MGEGRGLVTVEAGIVLVLPRESKNRMDVVIESQRILPTNIIVTGFALQERTLFGADLLPKPVKITVTGITGLLKTRPIISRPPLGHRLRGLLVAIDTFDRGVGAFKVKTRYTMIEVLLGLGV